MCWLLPLITISCYNLVKLTVRYQISMKYLIIILLLILSLSTGCSSLSKISEPETLFTSITLSPQTYIYERPVARSERIDTLKEGVSIEILQDPKNRWLKVRVPSGKIGWVESRDILRREYLEEWLQLKNRVEKRELQMKADTLDDANLRLRPGRDTVKVYKLFGPKTLEVYDVAHTERPGSKPVETNNITDPKLNQIDSKAKKPKKSKKNSNSEIKYDTWYLVKTPEKTVGWIYSGLVDIHVPEELALLSENKVIVSWRILTSTIDAAGKEHPMYLSIEREPNSNKDFDRVRVLYWNNKRSRYDLLHNISGISGIFPIESKDSQDLAISKPTFKIRYLSQDDPNVIIVDDYEITGTQAKKVNSTTEALQILVDESMEDS